MLEYIGFVIGIFLLVKGADYLIDGSSELASKWRVSKLLIGLTVVAFGTSAPELFINMIAAFNGSSDIAIGNIVGSNISNILLIMGIMLLLSPIKVKKDILGSEIPIAFISGLLLLFFAFLPLPPGHRMALSLIEGIILVVFFGLYVKRMRVLSKKITLQTKIKTKNKNGVIIAANIIGGIFGLYVGGQLAVHGAVRIATSLGLSQYVISLTIVAIGTSLPELVTGIVSVKKNQVDMGIGNIVGSNIFNILWVLGVTAIIRETVFPKFSIADITIMLIATVMLFIFAQTSKEKKLESHHGIAFLLLYIAYVAFLFLR